MHVAIRFLSVGFFSALVVAAGVMPTRAVEPQAPDELISAKEAVLIAIRSRLQNVKLGSRPTQFEKGDAIDRAGLTNFYASLGETADGPRREPLWVTDAGLTDKAKAVIREIGNAPQWGLPADAFEVPDLDGNFDGGAFGPRTRWA